MGHNQKKIEQKCPGNKSNFLNKKLHQYLYGINKIIVWKKGRKAEEKDLKGDEIKQLFQLSVTHNKLYLSINTS